MTVRPDALEEGLDRLRASVVDPRAGLFGPRSISWRVNREAAVLLGGGRAALLQLAHPFVAAAIRDHSRTQRDAADRFRGTFEHVFAMTFGDLESALHAARRVHAIHTHIHGEVGERVGAYREATRYEANQPAALAWVLATLIDTALLVHERLLTPLTPDEREDYYREARRFGLLFGLGERALPPDWTSFQAYMERMLGSGALAIGPSARAIAHAILTPARPSFRPAMAGVRLLTCGLLPQRFRDELGFRFGAVERLAFRALTRAIGATAQRLPPRLRYLPAYLDARRRLAGQPSRDPVGAALDRALLFLLRRPTADRAT